MSNGAARGALPAKSIVHGRASAAMLVLAMTVLFAATSAQAGGGKRCRDFSRLASFSMYGVSEWIANRFTDAELKTYGLGDFSIEQCLCNCADQPAPHYPYVLMLFRTPKGDLVGRPGPRGVETVITPLAVRHGERYCEVGDEEQCFGSFADPCEFTDFRYGDELAKYFPYCKPEDAHLR